MKLKLVLRRKKYCLITREISTVAITTATTTTHKMLAHQFLSDFSGGKRSHRTHVLIKKMHTSIYPEFKFFWAGCCFNCLWLSFYSLLYHRHQKHVHKLLFLSKKEENGWWQKKGKKSIFERNNTSLLAIYSYFNFIILYHHVRPNLYIIDSTHLTMKEIILKNYEKAKKETVSHQSRTKI